METECSQQTFPFQTLGHREVLARLDGGKITSDAGGLLPREAELPSAQCDIIRLKLLKIGAQIRVTVRKGRVSLAKSYPYRAICQGVYENLIRVCPISLRC